MKLRIPCATLSNSYISVGSFKNSAPEHFMKIENGVHTIETPTMNIDAGELCGNLQVRISLQYEYIEEMNALILSGGNYTGAEAVRLIVSEGNGVLGEVRVNQIDSAVRRKIDSPELRQMLKDYVRDTANRVVENAESLELTVLVRTDMVSLSPDEMDDLALVFRDGCFVELYNPDKDYGADVKIEPVKSYFRGTTKFRRGSAFWNVNGSTGDVPHGSTSWINFWLDNSDDVLADCVARGSAGIVCNNYVAGGQWYNIYGGHVVNNAAWVNPRVGVNGIVFILPICNAHNNTGNVNQMIAAFDTTAVWLDYYHQ